MRSVVQHAGAADPFRGLSVEELAEMQRLAGETRVSSFNGPDVSVRHRPYLIRVLQERLAPELAQAFACREEVRLLTQLPLA